MILIESFLQAILEIVLIPFVISNKPLNRGAIKEVSILSVWKRGENKLDKIFKVPLAFKIEITLENITTNPPIKKIVEILLVMLSARTSPKLENVTFLLLILYEVLLLISKVEDLFAFQNLKIIPTEMEARRCVIKSIIPIVVLLNIKIPTVTGEEEDFTIPDGTQSGTKFTLKNKGFRKIHSNASGDLIFTVQVQTPKKLTREQRELFVELAKTMNEQPPVKKRGFFG